MTKPFFFFIPIHFSRAFEYGTSEDKVYQFQEYTVLHEIYSLFFSSMLQLFLSHLPLSLFILLHLEHDLPYIKR